MYSLELIAEGISSGIILFIFWSYTHHKFKRICDDLKDCRESINKNGERISKIEGKLNVS